MCNSLKYVKRGIKKYNNNYNNIQDINLTQRNIAYLNTIVNIVLIKNI